MVDLFLCMGMHTGGEGGAQTRVDCDRSGSGGAHPPGADPLPSQSALFFFRGSLK
jgi:hypothetical protein